MVSVQFPGKAAEVETFIVSTLHKIILTIIMATWLPHAILSHDRLCFLPGFVHNAPIVLAVYVGKH